MGQALKEVNISKVSGFDIEDRSDILAVEEPLEIRLNYFNGAEQVRKNVSVTMRTPGNDSELTAGFLFTEGIIKSYGDISQIEYTSVFCAENKYNTVQVTLKPGVVPNLRQADRNFYTTSSCGVCGKGSIDAIRTVSAFAHVYNTGFAVNPLLLYRLPDMLRKGQETFDSTGGLHASALFSQTGELLLLREDVGRHNALDKLIGAALQQNLLPLDDKILLLSGRASFELVQKGVMAGIQLIAAVGAPSSLAVELAEEFNITLCGFLRDKRFNIYTAPARITLPKHETTY